MKALICGSLVYDHIMVFSGHFKKSILPGQLDNLNVSFMVSDMRREFGGCAGNIAYNLNMLAVDRGVPMGTVGKDFTPYLDWLAQHQIECAHIKNIDQVLTAQAFITTDLEGNQITIFHPGAMNHAHLTKVSEADMITIGIISPDGRAGMLEHAEQFCVAGIPFIFDPGQGLSMFDQTELRRFICQANWVVVNEYEWQLMQTYTGYDVEQVSRQVEALIITLGGRGSVIYTQGKEYRIPVVSATQIVDPTGCGDAYRAGVLYGLLNDMDWGTIGRIASLMGSIKVQCSGSQNHLISLDELRALFKQVFRYTF